MIDETGRDDQAVRINGLLGLPDQVVTHRNDLSVLDGNVCRNRRLSASVGDPTVPDEKIDHGLGYPHSSLDGGITSPLEYVMPCGRSRVRNNGPSRSWKSHRSPTAKDGAMARDDPHM